MNTKSIVIPGNMFSGVLTAVHMDMLSSYGVSFNMLIEDVFRLVLLGPRLKTSLDTIDIPNWGHLTSKIDLSHYIYLYNTNQEHSVFRSTLVGFTNTVLLVLHCLYYYWYDYIALISHNLFPNYNEVFLKLSSYTVLDEGGAINLVIDYDYLAF